MSDIVDYRERGNLPGVVVVREGTRVKASSCNLEQSLPSLLVNGIPCAICALAKSFKFSGRAID